MDLQRLAQGFLSAGAPVRARFGRVLTVNDDYTVDVTVGGEVTDDDVEDAGVSPVVPMDATGGTLGTATIDGIEYRTHTFTTAGTFVITDQGDNTNLEMLVIGGGGGGGGAIADSGGGGGGAGRLVELSIEPALGTATMVIGSGGAGGAAGTAGTDGGSTELTLPDASLVVAVGGGGGGRGASSSPAIGRNGGSGGGGGSNNTAAFVGGFPQTQAGGTALTGIGFGNNGGRGWGGSDLLTVTGEGGGGGGAGSQPSSFFGPEKDGGSGAISSLTSIPGSFGGGGGGGAGINFGTRTVGVGADGGGDGGFRAAGTAATGNGNGGGGAGGGTAAGFAGGAGSGGMVIFGYQITPGTAIDDVDVDTTGLESNQVSGVAYLGHGLPTPGQTVLMLTDGIDLVAMDSLAQPGSTISPRRYRTTNLAVVTATDTVVTFGTAIANDLLDSGTSTLGVPSDSRLHAKIPGWYQAVGAGQWAANATGNRHLWIRQGGSAILARQSADVDESVAWWQTVTTPVFYLDAGDYVELLARQTSGGNLDLVRDGDYNPSLTLTFLGP